MGLCPIEVWDPPSLGLMGHFLNRTFNFFLTPLPPILKWDTQLFPCFFNSLYLACKTLSHLQKFIIWETSFSKIHKSRGNGVIISQELDWSWHCQAKSSFDITSWEKWTPSWEKLTCSGSLGWHGHSWEESGTWFEVGSESRVMEGFQKGIELGSETTRNAWKV